jgi:hypothetical protein
MAINRRSPNAIGNGNHRCRALIDEVKRPAKPLSKARVRTKQVNAPAFDVRAALSGRLGVDLTQIVSVLTLRVGDNAHLLWIRDHNFLGLWRDHRADRGRVSGHFDND